MSLPKEPVAVAAKDDPVVEDIMHFEGGNVEPCSLKQGVGYEYVEFANSRKKSPLERKLVWKIDLLIVPILALIYLIAYLVSYSKE
jgi:hypothetical protein